VKVEDRLRLPPSPESAGRARAFVTSVLMQLGRADLADAAQLAVSEIVANAVLHARTHMEVAVGRTDGGVRIEVSDDNPTLPALREYGGYATTGRGLGVVAMLAAELGVEQRVPIGKRVWFVLDGSQERSDAETELGVGWDLGALAEAWDLDELLTEVTPRAAGGASAPSVAMLLGLPVRLWLAAQEHHDAVLRELGFYRREHPAREGQVRADWGEAKQAEALFAAAVEHALTRAGARTDARAGDRSPSPEPSRHLAPPSRTPDVLDVELVLRPGAAAQHELFAALQDALDEAEDLAADDRLLLRPALPEIVAVRDWCCEQVIAQSRGVAPTPWAGRREDLTGRRKQRRAATLPQWDDALVRKSTRCLLAADDGNRLVAVSRPAAELLGWDVDDLVGRRVVTIIPPHLREVHVAGFTRHLTTGKSHVLGVPLIVPALHADGHELICELLIERAPASAGRAVYIASLTPQE